MLKKYSSKNKAVVFNQAGSGDSFIDEYLSDPKVEISSVVLVKGDIDESLPHLPHLKCSSTGSVSIDRLIERKEAKTMVVEMLSHDKPVVLVFIGKNKKEGALKLKKIKELLVDVSKKPKEKYDPDSLFELSWA